MSGFSWGVQAASGFAAGLSATIPGGDRLLQLGIEIGVAGEGTAGYTFDITPDISEPVVDWQLTEQNLNMLFGSQPDVLQAILAELAIARSLGGGWENDFTEKYGDAIIFNAQQCFPARTPITLADGSTKPIADIRTGDKVLSFRPDGSLVAGTVTQLLENVTTEWVKLTWNDHGMDPRLKAEDDDGGLIADDEAWELVCTPGHHFLRPDGTFAAIADIIADDGQIVHADGSVIDVEAERIVYSAETTHLYEHHAMLKTWTSGGLAMAA